MYNYILSFSAQSLASHSEEPIYSTPITTTVTLHVSPSIYALTNALASTFSDVTPSPSIISPVSISLPPIITASTVHAPTNVLASAFSDVTLLPAIVSPVSISASSFTTTASSFSPALHLDPQEYVGFHN